MCTNLWLYTSPSPLLTYNCIANWNLNRTQLRKLCSLDRRFFQILGEPMTPIFNLIKKQAVLRVEKCLSVGVSSSFRNYFQMLEHKVSTRNNGKLLKIQKMKLEFARSGFLLWLQESSFLCPWKFLHLLQMKTHFLDK